MPWQPEPGKWYWCLRGTPPFVAEQLWENDRLDQLLRDTDRIFKTEEEARAALASRRQPT